MTKQSNFDWFSMHFDYLCEAYKDTPWLAITNEKVVACGKTLREAGYKARQQGYGIKSSGLGPVLFTKATHEAWSDPHFVPVESPALRAKRDAYRSTLEKIKGLAHQHYPWHDEAICPVCIATKTLEEGATKNGPDSL